MAAISAPVRSPIASELLRPAPDATSRPRRRDPSSGAFPNEISLELGQGPKNMEDKPTPGRGRVKHARELRTVSPRPASDIDDDAPTAGPCELVDLQRRVLVGRRDTRVPEKITHAGDCSETPLPRHC